MKLIVLTLVLIIALLTHHSTHAATDICRIPIDSGQPIKQLKLATSDTNGSLKLLDRAFHTGHSVIVYDYYKAELIKNPNSFSVNLLLGDSAYYNYLYSTAIAKTLLPGTPESNELKTVSERSLKKAYALNPNSGLANSLLGYYLWTNMISQQEGLKMLERGVQLAPQVALCHAKLALIIMNPAAKNRSLPRAIMQLEIAIKLDPTSANYHNMLGGAYWWSGQKDKAAEQYAIAKRLAQ